MGKTSSHDCYVYSADFRAGVLRTLTDSGFLYRYRRTIYERQLSYVDLALLFQKPERRGNEEIELVFVRKYVRGESLKRKMARNGSEAL